AFEAYGFNGAAILGSRNSLLLKGGPFTYERFNGAAILGSRNSRWGICGAVPCRGFNGAAILGSRNSVGDRLAAALNALLQWGRDPWIAELVGTKYSVTLGICASMGPRSLDRGTLPGVELGHSVP